MATLNSPTSNFSDVNAAVRVADRGDTVQVPASPSVAGWGNNSLSLSKGIWLKGPGRDSLTITGAPGSLNGLINIVPDTTAIANEEVIRITDFTLDGSTLPNSTSDAAIQVRGATSGSAKPFKNLAIGNCRFFKVTNNTSCIYIKGQTRGVVYNNLFDRCNMIMRTFGNDDPGEWTNSAYYPFSYGSADNLFFEGNSITWSATGDSFNAPGWTETGQGGRIVFRYNSWNFTNAIDYLGHTTNLEIFDIHGFQNWPGNGQTGSMVEEIYGNTISNYPGAPSVIHRGSWAMMHNNIITGTGTAEIQAREYGRGAVGGSGCTSEVPGASGNYTAEINNTYCFNTTLNGNPQNMINSGLGDACGCAENSSWYNYNASFNGSVGIGRGTSAPVMSATNGVGYWVNATATPSTNPTVVQAGHLYKRVGGVWVDYYHPYTYPHPLQTASPPPPIYPLPFIQFFPQQ